MLWTSSAAVVNDCWLQNEKIRHYSLNKFYADRSTCTIKNPKFVEFKILYNLTMWRVLDMAF
jgi:hypothetical protein